MIHRSFYINRANTYSLLPTMLKSISSQTVCCKVQIGSYCLLGLYLFDPTSRVIWYPLTWPFVVNLTSLGTITIVKYPQITTKTNMTRLCVLRDVLISEWIKTKYNRWSPIPGLISTWRPTRGSAIILPRAGLKLP